MRSHHAYGSLEYKVFETYRVLTNQVNKKTVLTDQHAINVEKMEAQCCLNLFLIYFGEDVSRVIEHEPMESEAVNG